MVRCPVRLSAGFSTDLTIDVYALRAGGCFHAWYEHSSFFIMDMDGSGSSLSDARRRDTRVSLSDQAISRASQYHFTL